MRMKRLLSTLLALAMTVTQMPIAALATGGETEAVVEETYTETLVLETDLPDNDELFAGYVDKMFYGGVSMYGIFARDHLKTDLEKCLYDLLKEQFELIASGQRSSTEIKILMSDLQKVVGSSAYSQFCNLDQGELFTALLADCPYDLYWYDKVSGTSWSYNPTSVTYYFSVADNYQGSSEFSVSPTVAAIQTAVNNAQNIVSANAGKKDYQKLLSYKNEICNLVDYNYDAAYTGDFSGNDDPWQLIHVFDGNSSTKVVCEGYSKAMQYLCDMTVFNGDVTCYSVSGFMDGGAHMWNIVNISGVNYLLDVTNSDYGTIGSDGSLFLAGGSGSATGGYVVSGISFIYRNEMFDLWGVDSLTLASSKYLEPAVDKINISTAEITLSQTEYVYDGTAKKPAVTVRRNGVTLQQGVDYRVTYSNNINASTGALAIVDGIGNYYGSYGATFTINKAIPVIYNLQCINTLTTENTIDEVEISGEASVSGILYLDEDQVLIAGTHEYEYTFVPDDSANYESIRGVIELTVEAIGTEAITGTCGTSATWILGADGTLTISGSGAMSNYKLASAVAPWRNYAAQVTSIVIEDGITTIGDCTFVDCINAASVSIADSVTYVGGYAFDNCGSLTEIMLPEGIDSIGCGAFRNCSSLKEIYLPKAIECSVMYDDIQYDTFSGCTSLTDVCFGGTAADWANISINPNGNDPLLNATIHIGKKHSTDPDPTHSGTFDGYTWKLVDGTLTISGSGWTDGFIYDNVQITVPWYGLDIERIVLEEGVTRIGLNAFKNCGDIESVTLPKSLTSIDGFAFSGCNPDVIYYAGSASDFAKISIGECNDGLVEEIIQFAEEEVVTYTAYINDKPVTGTIEGVEGDLFDLYIMDSNGNRYWPREITSVIGSGIFFTGETQGQLICENAGVWEIMISRLTSNVSLETPITITFNIAKAPEPSASLGDVNNDGTISNIDAMLVLQYFVGLVDATTVNASAADVNRDGSISNIDAMLILQYFVGLITEFPQ